MSCPLAAGTIFSLIISRAFGVATISPAAADLYLLARSTRGHFALFRVRRLDARPTLSIARYLRCTRQV